MTDYLLSVDTCFLAINLPGRDLNVNEHTPKILLKNCLIIIYVNCNYNWSQQWVRLEQAHFLLNIKHKCPFFHSLI